MTHIFDDPSRFKADAMDGFALAYRRYVTRMPDASGFIRTQTAQPGKVSLVVGGGSGHYPSYGGLVGPGLADACVLGELFASPSASQVERVARAANHGGGVVLSFGNYTGDRLNFGVAQDHLRRDGIDCRIVYVTDDVASGPPDESHRRRGIAGTFFVYKVGGAAAERGDGLEDVERLMRAANAATFSFGVAFGGCTLPGETEPLFSVAPEHMDLGLGIHGEPGIRSVQTLSAPELARVLVEAIVAERPGTAGTRAGVIVNGLGATKYEELFVLYRTVHQLLAEQGVEAVLPEVGELVTSLEMAGCSLSVMWLDEELEECWCAPAVTTAFRRDAADTVRQHAAPELATHISVRVPSASAPASAESIQAATVARAALAEMLATAVENEADLGRLDAIAGDGDHGIGMVRGLRAAVTAADLAEGGIGTVLRASGEAFGDAAGGTSGILWGLILSTLGVELGDQRPVTGSRLGAGLRCAVTTMESISEARLGDKTMVDALVPFVEAFETAVARRMKLDEAWCHAAEIANQAAAATAALTPKVGRARPLAHRSIGTADPGASSIALMASAVTTVLKHAAEAGPRHQPLTER